MTLDCSNIATIIASLPLVKECDKMCGDILRLCTPFMYPNGEHIDVYLSSEKTLWGELFLSDRGQTSGYLRNAKISWNSTTRKRELVSDIIRGSGITLKGEQLTVRLESNDPLAVSEAIFSLSQACVRLSDFATHQRLRSTNAFKDDVEDFFAAHDLTFDRDVYLPPVYGQREIRMDFKVEAQSKISYVNIMAAMNEVAAHQSSNEIVVKLIDLQKSQIMSNFVTVYNSASNAFRTEDLERLSGLSNIVAYPEQGDTLLAVLRDNPLPFQGREATS